MTLSAGQIAVSAGAPGAGGGPWFLRAVGDGMAPTIRPGDMAAVAPVSAWRGAGLYVVDAGMGPDLYRCDVVSSGRIALWRDNPAYARHEATLAQFVDGVRGQVFGIMQIVDPSLL